MGEQQKGAVRSMERGRETPRRRCQFLQVSLRGLFFTSKIYTTLLTALIKPATITVISGDLLRMVARRMRRSSRSSTTTR